MTDETQGGDLAQPEEDPTAVDPAELPPKPPIEDMPPEEGDAPPDEDDEFNEDDFLDEGEADQDDTVDDAEEEEPRSTDLPEGARREDYGDDDDTD